MGNIHFFQFFSLEYNTLVGPFCENYVPLRHAKIDITENNYVSCRFTYESNFDEGLYMIYVMLTRKVMENHIIGLESFKACMSDKHNEIRRKIDELFHKEYINIFTQEMKRKRVEADM